MSAVLSALPDLPPLVPAGTKLNGKPIRIPPRVNLGDLTVNNVGTVKKLHNCLFPVNYSERFYQDLVNLDVSPEDYNKLVFYQDLPVGVLVSRLEPLESEAPTDLASAVTNAATAEQNDENKGAYKLYIMTLGVLAPYRNQGLASKMIHHALTAASNTLLQPTPVASSSTGPEDATESASKPAPAPPAAPTPAPQPPLSKKAAKKAAQKGKSAAAGASTTAPASASNLPPPVPIIDETVPPELDEKEKKKLERQEQELKRSRRRIEKCYCHVQVGNDESRKFFEKWGFSVVATVPDYYRKIEPRDAWLMERAITAPASSTD
ncbi:hypothetical protein JCM10212_003507 [Sporobolomyces blumeae]